MLQANDPLSKPVFCLLSTGNGVSSCRSSPQPRCAPPQERVELLPTSRSQLREHWQVGKRRCLKLQLACSRRYRRRINKTDLGAARIRALRQLGSTVPHRAVAPRVSWFCTAAAVQVPRIRIRSPSPLFQCEETSQGARRAANEQNRDSGKELAGANDPAKSRPLLETVCHPPYCLRAPHWIESRNECPLTSSPGTIIVSPGSVSMVHKPDTASSAVSGSFQFWVRPSLTSTRASRTGRCVHWVSF